MNMCILDVSATACLWVRSTEKTTKNAICSSGIIEYISRDGKPTSLLTRGRKTDGQPSVGARMHLLEPVDHLSAPLKSGIDASINPSTMKYSSG